MTINSDNKNVALIEICGSHDECLYSQVKFLSESGLNVFLIISDNLDDRVKWFDNVAGIISFKFGTSLLNDLINLFKIRRTLKSKNIRNVIINTASNEIIAKLVNILPVSISVVGIIHSLKKLNNSFSQTLINHRIKKYFVLNDYLLNYIPQLEDTRFESFYPIYFPEYNYTIPKAENDFWVAIPGQIEFKRRDYLGLVHSLQKANLDKQIKILFLGNSCSQHSDAPKIKEMIKNDALNNNLVFFRQYIDPMILFAYIKQSDLILPLLNPGVAYYPDYINNQISGTFNLSFAFNIPMLLHSDFSGIDDFDISSIYYTNENIIEKINDIHQNPYLLSQHKEKMLSYSKFSIEYSKNKYINFINH